MGNTIQTNDGRYYQKPSIIATAGGIATGAVAAQAIQLGQLPIGNALTGRMGKVAQSVNPDEISRALQQALKNGNIADKVVIQDFRSNPQIIGRSGKPQPFFSAINTNIKNIGNKFVNYIKESLDLVGAAKKGKNAFFNPANNQIMINSEKLGTAGFHEIGHAINFNNSKFWRAMQKIRPVSMFAPAVILAISLFKRKKAEGEQPQGFFDKTTTFIKNNAGKLAGLSMLPIVAEELKATQRGNALAKQIVSVQFHT